MEKLHSERRHFVLLCDGAARWEMEEEPLTFAIAGVTVSPTTTLNRDAVPIGDDIEPVGESRAGVETGNDEEESLVVGTPTFEMIQKNPTSREEQELEGCGHADYRSWCVVCVKDRCSGKHLQVAPLEKEERARTKPPLPSFDCVFLTQEIAHTTLEYENEPSLVLFRDVPIHSYVEVVVRITDDIPLRSWIPHFATKVRTGRGWKKSVAQFGDEELTSFVKRIIQGVFVCHYDRTRRVVHFTRSGILRGRSWTRQILATGDQPRMLVKEPLEFECRKFYVLYANIEAHGHMGSCPVYALFI